MINDYSQRYFPAAGHRLPARWLFFQKKNSRQLSADWLLWKPIGVMLVVALAGGVGSSIWLGGKIGTALGEINKSQAMHAVLTEKNAQLLAQKERLLARERIEAAAKNLGLYPPSAEQLRRP